MADTPKTGQATGTGAPAEIERVFAGLSSQELKEIAQTVDKPAAGEEITIQVSPGQPIAVTFDLSTVEIVQSENDISVLFPDASVIRFVSLIPAAFSSAPPLLLMPDGSIISSIELIDLASSLDALGDTLEGVELASNAVQASAVTEFADGRPDSLPLNRNSSLLDGVTDLPGGNRPADAAMVASPPMDVARTVPGATGRRARGMRRMWTTRRFRRSPDVQSVRPLLRMTTAAPMRRLILMP